MREYKFRAFNKKTKEMLSVAQIDFKDKFVIVRRQHGKDLSSYKTWQFKDIELMQYIGLKDRNKKEIYKDDILKQEDEISVVGWNERYAEFDTTIGDINGYTAENDCEVIGNKFVNSELLQEVK